ncbi:MAG: protein-tyrosine-phosphatase [Kiritimatiellia bacterium]|jgi:protein-tyrosine-phosphatase
MAEGLAREFAAQRSILVETDSAGTLGLIDRQAAANARAVLLELGINIDDHRSKGLSNELVDWADRVLVMTYDHASFVHEHYPQLGLKVELLGPYGGRNPELADPVGSWKRRFRKSRGELTACVEGLLDRLD